MTIERRRLVQTFSVPPVPETECLESLGTYSSTGYPFTRLAGQQVLAHRFAYEIARGPIAEGLVIDHLCRNKGCINPEHLDAVTQRINASRGQIARLDPNGEGLSFTRFVWTKRTHCKYGHELNDDSIYISKAGGLSCQRCRAYGTSHWPGQSR